MPRDFAIGRADIPKRGRRHISDSLVWTFLVIVVEELPHDVIQVRLAHHHEVVQAFLLERLNEPLR